ncbi:metallophosphoesterase [bacterium]|nr:metallophosphoesterase [bacterium]
MIPNRLPTSLVLSTLIWLPPADGIAATAFGTVKVRQINGTNNTTGVALSLSPGASPEASVTGGNRGDYTLTFGNPSDPATGVLISCPAQNSRDDSAAGGPAAGPHQATTAVQVSGSRFYLPVFRTPEGDEANLDSSFVFLPHDTWLGGLAANQENDGAIVSLTGSSALALGTHFTDSTATEGEYRLSLTSLVTNASQNGILLVCGAKNEDNFALSRADADGGFTIHCHDNGQNGADHENDGVAFAYLPVSAVGSNRLAALGRVNGDATTDVAAGAFAVTKGGTGRWFLSISGHARDTGTLIVSPAGGGTNNSDNIVSSEWDADHGRWVIESSDLPGASLQNMSTAGEDAFSFAFFALPGATGTPPTVSLDIPSAVPAGTPVTLTATAGDDGSVAMVRFYAGDVLLGGDLTPPYQFVWNLPPLGNHLLNARATDHLGFVTRSASVPVNVRPAPGSGGLFFDGTDDHVAFGNNPAFRLTTFTLECWFRREPGGTATDSGGLQAIPLIAKGRADAVGCNFLLGIDAASGKLAADFKDQSGENHPLLGASVIPPRVWQHAAATFDGSGWRIYLNGSLEAATDTGGRGPRSDAVQHTALGTALDSAGIPDGGFLGLIDEVRVWNTARTPAELRNGLNVGIPSAPGLVARHGMGESSGNFISSTAGGLVQGTLINGVFRTAGAPFDLDVPPAVAVTAPVHQAAGISRNALLTTFSDDPDDATLTVRFFGRETANGPLADFTLVALPDTQFYSENTGGGLAEIFSAQTDWIVARRESLNIAGVLHLGDITQRGDNPSTAASEWSNAANAMYRLENPLTTTLPHGIPYVMAVGNHDQTPIGNADGTTLGFNTHFGVNPASGVNHFAGQPYYGGTSVPDSADNNHILFRAGGVDFIVISLEFDNTPDTQDLAWADGLLKAHPTRCGIVISHWTVGTGNPAAFSPQGAAIYQALKANPNLILMHGGHIAGEGRRADTWQGRTVHSLLADYQSRSNGGDGWLRILTFRPALNRIDVQTYSPTLDRFETDDDSHFSLNADLAGRGEAFVELGTLSGPPGKIAFAWNGLGRAARYEWYAEVNDGTSIAKTPLSTFTTAGTQFPPTVSLTAPENGATFSQGQPITLTTTAADPDGSVAAVRYYSGTTLLGETLAEPHVFKWHDAAEGVHTVIVKAIDNEGLEGSALPSEIRVLPLPNVTILATDATAGEHGGDSTVAFSVSRDGLTNSSLSVNYTLSGTATPSLDFAALPGSVELPAGQSSAAILPHVLPDELAEGDETLVLTLADGAGYQLREPSAARAIIRDRPFDEWLFSRKLGPALDDDDGDGVSNILEYAMGTRADVAGSNGVRAVAVGAGAFIAVFPRAKGSSDVSAELQWSADLATWHGSGVSDGTRTAVITTRVISGAGEDPETLEATTTLSAGPRPAAFYLRLAVRR